jgi:putative transposase
MKRNFRYRIKGSDTEQLEGLIVTSNCIWNYALMIQRKYYEWYGKYLSSQKLQAYIAKKRKRNSYWLKLNSQSVQEIVQRLDASYQRFFKKTQKRPPRFKNRYDDGSFCFKQCGYKIDNDRITVNKIGTYRFLKHRAYPNGKPATVRIKRYNNRFFVIICCEYTQKQLARDCNGTAGIDFGLKTFMTFDIDSPIESPRFLFSNARKLRKLSKVVSRRKKGSNRRKKAVAKLSNFHAKVKQQRDAWQWEKAHELCKQYAIIKIEDLCLKGWQAMWGRKASDLAIGEFILKLEYVASKYGTQIVKVPRWFASSHICSSCGHKLERKLGFNEREWQCVCGVAHDRDVNAAKNIKQWDTTVRSVDTKKTTGSNTGASLGARTRSPML